MQWKIKLIELIPKVIINNHKLTQITSEKIIKTIINFFFLYVNPKYT